MWQPVNSGSHLMITLACRVPNCYLTLEPSCSRCNSGSATGRLAISKRLLQKNLLDDSSNAPVMYVRALGPASIQAGYLLQRDANVSYLPHNCCCTTSQQRPPEHSGKAGPAGRWEKPGHNTTCNKFHLLQNSLSLPARQSRCNKTGTLARYDAPGRRSLQQHSTSYLTRTSRHQRLPCTLTTYPQMPPPGRRQVADVHIV